ncbi:MAG: RidA family protein [Actinobacteria bacterium]|nr:RidA family protein [Actinomycetota bacterium]
MTLAERAAKLGLTVPEPLPPAGEYAPVRVVAGCAYVSGQGPLLPTGGFVCGKVGADLSLAEAREASGLAAISALVTLEAALGTLDRVTAIGRVVGYVNCAPGFNATPAVMDGCSEMLRNLLGEPGVHARSAIGVSELPFDIAVEIDVTAHLNPLTA